MPRKRPPPATIIASSTFAHARAQREIGMADDAGADARLAVAAAGAHRRDAVGELDLADRAHLLRPVGAIHREPFEIDGGDDIVSAADVGQQVRQQIARRSPADRSGDDAGSTIGRSGSSAASRRSASQSGRTARCELIAFAGTVDVIIPPSSREHHSVPYGNSPLAKSVPQRATGPDCRELPIPRSRHQAARAARLHSKCVNLL